MFFWVQWNVCWHSVGDSLLCSFFIVWSHCRSFSPQRSSHEALGHIADECNIRWAADNVKCHISPSESLLMIACLWCHILLRLPIMPSGVAGIWIGLVSPSPSLPSCFPSNSPKVSKRWFFTTLPSKNDFGFPKEPFNQQFLTEPFFFGW